MQKFITDYTELDLIEVGEYQGLITKATKGVTPNGKEKIDLQIQIVSPKYKNRVIFDTKWTESEESVKFKFNSISKAVGIRMGERFANLGEWLEQVINESLKFTVKHEEYNGQTKAKVEFYRP